MRAQFKEIAMKKTVRDNRSRQLNPQHPTYSKSRAGSSTSSGDANGGGSSPPPKSGTQGSGVSTSK